MQRSWREKRSAGAARKNFSADGANLTPAALNSKTQLRIRQMS